MPIKWAKKYAEQIVSSGGRLNSAYHENVDLIVFEPVS